MRKLLLLVAGLAVFFAGPAWATYNHQMVLHGEGAGDVRADNVRFVTSDGTRIPVTNHYIAGGFLIQFPGDQPEAGQLTVSTPGDGENGHVIDIPGAETGKILHVNLDNNTSTTTSNLGNPFDNASEAEESVAADNLDLWVTPGHDQDFDEAYVPLVDFEPGAGSAAGRVPIFLPDDEGTSTETAAAQSTGNVTVDLQLATIEVQSDPVEDAVVLGSRRVRAATWIIAYYGEKPVILPGTGTGTVVHFGGESALARLGLRLNLTGYEVEASTRLPSIDSGGFGIFSVSYSEYSGNDQASGSVAAGDDDVAITYQDFGGNGVTGVFLGASGLEGRIHRDVDTMDIGVELGWDMPHSHGTRLQPSVFLNYGSMKTRINHRLMTPSFADIHQMTWTSLDEHYWDLGAGTYLTLQFDTHVSGGIGLHGFARQSDTDFSSKQTNTCGICGPDNNFTSMLRESDDELNFGVRGSMFLRYDVTDRISFNVRGQATYLDSRSGVFNPTSGDDLFVDNHPAGIVTKDAFDWSFMVGGGFGF